LTFTKPRTNHLIWLSTLAAVATGLALWTWWASFDRPNPLPRPHVILGDIVSVWQRGHGLPTAPGDLQVDDHPFTRAAVWLMDRLAPDWRVISLVQWPFLALLVIATMLLAWRLGGAAAAFVAPWVAVLGPMTVGLALHLDDLLALQAMLTAAVALLAWSDAARRWPAFLVGLPLALGVRLAVYYSNGLFLLAVFAGAGGAWWWFIARRTPVGRDWRRQALAAVGLALAIGTAAAWPIETASIARDAAKTDWGRLSICQQPTAVFSWPAVWFYHFVGPVMGVVALGCLPLLGRKKTRGELLFLLGWLVVPMAVMTAISKRHDFYLVTVVPATYALIAVGLAAINRPRIRLVVSLAVVLALFVGWIDLAQREPNRTVTKRLSAWFANEPQPFLFSPRTVSPSGYEAVARALAARLPHERAQALFATEHGLNGWEMFFVWHAAPHIAVGDARYTPLTGDPRCVVTREGGDVPPLEKTDEVDGWTLFCAR
jgi:hypothetical protein